MSTDRGGVMPLDLLSNMVMHHHFEKCGKKKMWEKAAEMEFLRNAFPVLDLPQYFPRLHHVSLEKNLRVFLQEVDLVPHPHFFLLLSLRQVVVSVHAVW